MLTPMKFRAVYKDYLWGGERLKDFGKVDPEGKRIAESWELAHHSNGESIVKDGPNEGKSLGDLLSDYGRDLVGSLAREEDLLKFPLLIKLIDAKQNLSVQVHPNDAQATTLRPGEYGKNEMWYIVEAPSDGKLIAGLKPEVSRGEFAQSIDEGRCEDDLRYVNIEAGQVLNIPAGLVHAITAGTIVYEVQQNSDTTFRVYDYQRRGDDGKLRELHVDEALEVSRIGEDIQAVFPGLNLGQGVKLLVHNKYFDVRSIRTAEERELSPDGKSFHVLTVLNGSLTLATADGTTHVEKGETVLIPAAIESYVLKPESDIEAVLSQLPDPAEMTRAQAEAQAQSMALSDVIGLEPRS